MKQYKVKVIALSLNGNKVAKFGDIVNQSQVAADCKDLVKSGYLEKAKSKKDKKESKESAPEPTLKELLDAAYNEGTLDRKQLKTMTNEAIEAYAGTLDIEVEGTKAEMIAEILKPAE